jgi:hypothetical protein
MTKAKHRNWIEHSEALTKLVSERIGDDMPIGGASDARKMQTRIQ